MDEIVYGYDLQGNLSNIEYNFGTITSNTHYNFETGAEQDFYDFTTYNNGYNTIKRDYIYDDYNLRNLKKIQYFINSSSTSYFDLEFDYVTNTTRVEKITYNFTYSRYTDISYKYYYDSLGNITKEEYLENGAIQVKKEYIYDDYNQLIKESSRDYQYTTASSYENTNYSKYYYYDLNGNITDIREYGYGTCDMVTYTIPSFVEINTGLYDLKMYYNTIHDYNDIYTLNIGQSPSLTFKYFDESNNVWVTGLTTNMTYSNLNVNQEGYYYRNYTATDGFFYNIQFRIVFKVGNPVNHYRDAEKHVSYSYDDDWLDQLESYSVFDNGVSKTSNITYDNQGNPIQITNFDYMGIKHNYATLEWNGRELVNITVYNSSLAVVGEIDYTYNDEGIRIKKVVQDSLGITTYHYKLSGSTLVAELVDNGYDDTTGQRNLDYKIIYNYDYNGSLIGFTLYAQGYTFDYIYVMNQLGDITHIITTSGTVAVEYKYDAYGNIVEIIGDANIANANSFRYRSYKYDIETDLYYLNSRYYNPEIGRFISSDGLLGQMGNIHSTNMYAYCANNPVMFTDSTGYFAISIAVIGLIAGVIIGGTAGGIIAYNVAKDNGAEGWELVGWTAAGIVGGAAIGAAIGYGVGTLITKATGVLGFSFIKGNVFVITDTIVIGHYGYAGVGTALGYGYYQIPNSLYNSLSAAEQWAYNSTYLKDCATLGANFIVEPNRSIEVASALYSEVALLIDWGYRWLEDLTALVR